MLFRLPSPHKWEPEKSENHFGAFPHWRAPIQCAADKEWKSKQRAESNWLKGQTSLLHPERERERARSINGELDKQQTGLSTSRRQATCLLAWSKLVERRPSFTLKPTCCLVVPCPLLLKNEGGNSAEKKRKTLPTIGEQHRDSRSFGIFSHSASALSKSKNSTEAPTQLWKFWGKFWSKVLLHLISGASNHKNTFPSLWVLDYGASMVCPEETIGVVPFCDKNVVQFCSFAKYLTWPKRRFCSQFPKNGPKGGACLIWIIYQCG